MSINFSSPFELPDEGTTRPIMPLIFVVDTSGSMTGNKIGSVNVAIPQALSEVDKISSQNNECQIKVALLDFSSDAHWQFDQLIDAASYSYQPLQAGGLTNFGEACAKLNHQLSRSHGFLKSDTGLRAPAIILLSDGEPNDAFWPNKLAELHQNKWFKSAVKLAIAIGDEGQNNMDVLSQFTGTKEGVFTVHNIDDLIAAIHTASSVASKVGSSSIQSDLDDKRSDSEIANQTAIDQMSEQLKDRNIDHGDTMDFRGMDEWSNSLSI